MKSLAARWTGRIVRVAIFTALIVWLARQLDWLALREVCYTAIAHPLGIIAGVVLMLLTSLTAALRWRGLLLAQNVALPAGRVMSIFFIGQFFNSFMLGACGGDMARIYYILRDTTARRTETATSVLIDRGIGVFVQILVGCLLILIEWPLFRAHGAVRTAGLLMLGAGMVALLAGVALLWKNIFERFPLLHRLTAAHPLGTRVRRAYEEFFLYRRRPRALATAIGYSLLNLLIQVAATACLGHSLGLITDFSTYLVFFPIISVLTAIPLTPGSFGVRESLFVLLFQSVGVDPHQAVMLSLLYYATALVWNLAGGIVFLGFSAGAGLNLREELARIRHSRDDNDTAPPSI